MAFTAAELSGFMIGLFGFILTIVNLVDKGMALREKAKEPQHRQDERVAKLEERVNEIGRILANDDKRIEHLEAGTKALIKGVNALLAHSLDDNNIEEVQKAKKGLDVFLISNV